MKPLLHNWILPSQTGFVPNRCILDNVFLAFEAIEWALESKQDTIMLLLDFEKAYDRVSWTFLEQTMNKMGFDSTWTTKVMSLNRNSSAKIIVNGEPSQAFQLQRSVRQGCPLAPYLFLLTVDVLGQMLQHPACQVKGLRLPDNTHITNQMFADDTLLLLEGNPANLDQAITVINKFGEASGAKLNLHKSVGVWISHTDRAWAWGEEAGLKWLQKGEVTRYLGYPFGLQIAQQEKDNKMLGQIRKHLHRWAGNKLSLAGRIMIANQVILSSIWYIASCMDFSNTAITRATVRNYMWSGKGKSTTRARVKWATAVLPIVRGGVKIIDPQWQASALLVKLLIRGLSVGYEPWKVLVRYRVSQTRQSRRGKWPTHANWTMNNHHLLKQGSSLWQGVMRAWNTMQSGLEQQDPHTWAEIMRQPLYGNRMLTNELGVQWGTEPISHMRWWAEKGFLTLKNIARNVGHGWRTYQELITLRRAKIAPALYARLVLSIPWDAYPRPTPSPGQWLAAKVDNNIQQVYHLHTLDPHVATLYRKDLTEQLALVETQQRVPIEAREVRVVRTLGPRNTILDFNPTEETPDEQKLWLWGNAWLEDLEWDPKDWNWRRLGILPETSVLNYSTKRGYRVAMRQDNQQAPLDAELEAIGFDSKSRAKFWNRIWHPYLPRKISAMQWLILTDGLPVGEWREKLGMDGACQLCIRHAQETLPHAFLNCEEVAQAWDLFRKTRARSGLHPAYLNWIEVSRGLMTPPEGPSIDSELRWDTAAAFTINMETPWDLLRAQLLWAIWCQRLAHAFNDERFHLGLVLWYAWRNTVYAAMEAYKELHRHKRNEEKRQQQIDCFQKVWTQGNIFGRMSVSGLKWHLTPSQDFLPQELGAWTIPPIRIHRASPSPDFEAEFVAQPDFDVQIQNFLSDIGNNYPLPTQTETKTRADSQGHRNQASQDPQLQERISPAHPCSRNQEEEESDTNDQRAVGLPPNGQIQVTGAGPEPPAPHTAGNQAHSRTTADHILNEEPPGRTRTRPTIPKRRIKLKCKFGPRSSTKGDTANGDQWQPITEQNSPSNTAGPSSEGWLGGATGSQENVRTPLAPLNPNAHQQDIHRSGRQRPEFDSPNQQRGSTGPCDEGGEAEIDALLREIDTVRTQDQGTPAGLTLEPEAAQTGIDTNDSLNIRGGQVRYVPRITSRRKAKCHFGPHQRGVGIGRPGSLNQEGSTSFAQELPSIVSPQRPQEEPPRPSPDENDPGLLCPPACRVTFTHPGFRHRPPITRYYPWAEEAPRLNPNRFAYARMGLTAEMLDARVTAEVNELLDEMMREKRLAEIMPGPTPDIPRVLSKEDCLTLFRATGIPRPGSGALYGVYRWAANLDEARYNYEDDGGDLSFLDDWILQYPDVNASTSTQAPPAEAQASSSNLAHANSPDQER